MNWLIFSFTAWLLLAIQYGTRGLLEIGQTGIEPSYLLVFMVFLAAMAPSAAAMWAGLVLGLLIDLTLSYPSGDAAITLIGPHAFGFSLGALLVMQLRSLVYRKHPLTMLLLTLLAGIVAHLLAVFLISLRALLGAKLGVYPAFEWAAIDELFTRFFVVLYSAVLAVPLGWLLHAISPVFGLATHHHHHQRVTIAR